MPRQVRSGCTARDLRLILPRRGTKQHRPKTGCSVRSRRVRPACSLLPEELFVGPGFRRDWAAEGAVVVVPVTEWRTCQGHVVGPVPTERTPVHPLRAALRGLRWREGVKGGRWSRPIAGIVPPNGDRAPSHSPRAPSPEPLAHSARFAGHHGQRKSSSATREGRRVVNRPDTWATCRRRRPCGNNEKDQFHHDVIQLHNSRQ